MIRIRPAAIDLILVLVFAIAGRASHSESLDLAEIVSTALPFLLACLLAWLVLALLDDDGRGLRAAVVVWLVTVVVGMGFRITLGGQAAVPFILVASGTLALLFGGWRLVWWLVLRRRAQSAAAA